MSLRSKPMTTTETVLQDLLGQSYGKVMDKLTGEERRTLAVIIAQSYANMLKERCDVWKFLTMLEKAAMTRKGTGMAANLERSVVVIRGELKAAGDKEKAAQ